ncbi:NAD-dependent epimerase/dehydratase family protein [Syntrophothermus lipocalidus]|uniref:NAD-dependent epimerase/dehydratase n=1 Tax=Syntrophothermus lipocalidus (strain DSM 12680 / TGB-C1) TaxID=643648 RepID=D7CJ75_SYNLT|nr:NAD-dependent epimerase/dehydratase family protein [Syntrophothermus lipocalidus]ADI00964.1 NAD-dependent epimerase/dehydratase [Syntrophothermus lipocalidus DSM 12680]
MKTVLVTGAAGFIGKNLCAALEQRNDIKILAYDKDNSAQELAEFAACADFVFHLAGVNRPQNVEEFDEGNWGFTVQLLELLAKSNRNIPIAVTSSIQAALDNPYGVSKKKAEDALWEWSHRSGAPVYIYRLPNVFGKWCRPNYNSVVATFCYNIARGLPIQINNPDAELTLVYIDDVVAELISAMEGNPHKDDSGFCYVPRTFKVTLQRLADTIYSFAASRKTLVVPNFENDLERFLYATYISYLSEDDFGYELEMKHDHRGWLAEFIKSKQFGQIFVSRTRPGITRGNHWHHTKVEKFLVIEGKGIIQFRRIDTGEILSYEVSGEKPVVVDIPPGYTHSITNIGDNDLITLFWADEIFDEEHPDTYYAEV